jgi:hypothetical protein
MRAILVFLMILMALTTRADDLYALKVNSVLAVSPGTWQDFVRDELQGDKYTCQQMVDGREAMFITRPLEVFLISVERNLALVRIEGSSEAFWTSISTIKKN